MAIRAVVFAYHDVGVRCLKVLQASGVEIALVVTHENQANENCWFESVAALATTRGWPLHKTSEANSPSLLKMIKETSADFIFSFYYRQLLSSEILQHARRGAFNMHGSLLPHYRGCAPVNWAILHGEKRTGATLHEMTARPDAGAIIAQTAVSILPDETAVQVMHKVALATETTLRKALPDLIAGRAVRIPNRLEQGSYFRRRTIEDGRIDWQASAQDVYNLIRAVAPPYPGAFTEMAEHRFIIGAAHLLDAKTSQQYQNTRFDNGGDSLGLQIHNNGFVARCGDGGVILVQTLFHEGRAISPSNFVKLMGRSNAYGTLAA